MTAVRNGTYWQLRLMPGEEIVETLAGFVRRHRIKSGFLTAIGAAEDITLGCFNPKTRTYHKRTFAGDHEVAALVGNVAWDGKDPLCHIHAVISTPRLVTFAGHLFSGKVTVTLEVALVPGTRRLNRRPDPLSGLKLLHLSA
ncbi:MAG: DNA-binding protein [candidate division WOR-3 bacterium]|nr:DNA-binding protein [candidate division WOR-3 bacterium]